MKSGSAGVVQEKSSSLVDEFGQLQRFRVQRVLPRLLRLRLVHV